MMSWFSFGLFSGKLKLNKSYFARKKLREESEFFDHIYYALASLGNVFVAVFFSSTIETVTFSVQDLLVMLANVCLAAGNLYNFGLKSYKTRSDSPIERLLTIVGLIMAIAIAIILFPAVFSVALTPSTLLTCCSTLATAINLFFGVKNIVIPPLKRLLENFFSYWGNDIREDYPPEILLDPIQDNDVIRILLKLDSEKRIGEEHASILAKYNKMLVKMYGYKNKYNESFLGGMFRRPGIQKMRDCIADINVRGEDSAAIKFIHDKYQRKAAKIIKLRDAIASLENACSHENWVVYNEKALEYFENFESVTNPADMKSSWEKGRSLLSDEVERQQNKLNSLKECPLPPELTPPGP